MITDDPAFTFRFSRYYNAFFKAKGAKALHFRYFLAGITIVESP